MTELRLQKNAGKSYVFYLNEKVLLDLFTGNSGFYRSIEEVVLIVPDWKYYNDLEKSSRANVIVCADPITTNLYYDLILSWKNVCNGI